MLQVSLRRIGSARKNIFLFCVNIYAKNWQQLAFLPTALMLAQVDKHAVLFYRYKFAVKANKLHKLCVERLL